MIDNQEAIQRAMKLGHSAAWDQDWDEAASFYRQALEIDPNHTNALTSLGLALKKMEDYQNALKCYQRAAEINPDDPLSLENTAKLSESMRDLRMALEYSMKAAEIYLRNNDVNKAIENWERITRINPGNITAHLSLAKVNNRLGQKRKAVNEYLAVASLIQAAGNQEKALYFINVAKQIDPNNQKVLQALNLVKDFRQLPKPVAAIEVQDTISVSKIRQLEEPQLEKEAGLDPVCEANQAALIAIAEILFEGSSGDGSSDIVSSMSFSNGKSLQDTEKWSQVIIDLSRAIDLETQGDFVNAIATLEHVLDLGLDHPAVYFNLGYLYFQTGRFDNLAPVLQQVITVNDYALGAHFLLADFYYQTGEIDAAALEFLNVLKLADVGIVPENKKGDLLNLYEGLIDSYQKQSNLEQKSRLCENIRNLLKRSDWKIHLKRAREQLPSHGQPGLALPLAELLIEAKSSRVIESMSKIYDMTRRKQYRSAMEESFYVLQDAPAYLPLHSLVADILVEQNDIDKAITKLQVIAKTYCSRGELQQAIEYYRRIIELSPADIQARKMIITHLIELKQTKVAIQEYKKLAEVYYQLADLKMAHETYSEALQIAKQADLEPELQAQLLNPIADIDLQNLDWRQALRNYEQMRSLIPEEIEPRYRIIEMHFRLGQERQALAEIDNFSKLLIGEHKIDSAIEFLEKIAQEHSDHIPIRRRLADLYKQAGRDKDAIQQLDAIGELLLNSGDRRGATQVVEMILSLGPPNKGDYQKKLEQLRTS